MAHAQHAEAGLEGQLITETTLHFVFAEIHSRLQLFAQAITLCPNIVVMMAEQNPGTRFATAEEMVRIVCLNSCEYE